MSAGGEGGSLAALAGGSPMDETGARATATGLAALAALRELAADPNPPSDQGAVTRWKAAQRVGSGFLADVADVIRTTPGDDLGDVLRGRVVKLGEGSKGAPKRGAALVVAMQRALLTWLIGRVDGARHRLLLPARDAAQLPARALTWARLAAPA